MHIPFLKKKKKKIVEWICGNGIAEIGGEFVAIVAMPLLKMGGEKK